MKTSEIVTMKLADLDAAPYNPRRISPRALEGLKKSLQTFGVVQPIVWNKRSKRIVGGHQRRDALLQLGETKAQVVVVDLKEKDEKALNIALNSTSIEGEFTDDVVALLTEIKLEDENLFTDLRFDDLLKDLNKAPIVGNDHQAPAQYESKFMVLVELATEAKQLELLETLTAQGHSCKALVS